MSDGQALALGQDLSANAAESLHRACLDAMNAGRDVSVDGRDVERISTPALQVLIAASRTIAAAGGRFTLLSPSGALRDGLADLGVADIETAEAPAASPPPPAEGGVRILVAEDNKLNQKVLVAMLSPLGEVVIAPDGAKAVEEARSGDFDLIIMDSRMPEMDGPSASEAIRELDGARGRTPIIALSADTEAHHLDRYKAAGMDDCLAKPIDHAALLAMVEKWMNPENRTADATDQDAGEDEESNDDVDALLKQMEAFAAGDGD